jgi:hypothetical protein
VAHVNAVPAIVSRTPVRASGVRGGAALFLLRDLHRPLQRDRGPVHGPDLHPLPGGPPRPAGHPARLPRPPASPGSSGAARSRVAAAGSSAPGTWSGTPRPSTRPGRPPTSCGRIRTSASGSCTAATHHRLRAATWNLAGARHERRPCPGSRRPRPRGRKVQVLRLSIVDDSSQSHHRPCELSSNFRRAHLSHDHDGLLGSDGPPEAVAGLVGLATATAVPSRLHYGLATAPRPRLRRIPRREAR